MTSKLTREERVQALYDLKVGQVLSMADIENVKMLSRMALATMDSEPVAYMYRDNLHSDARFSMESKIGNWSPEDINEYEISETPLYRHAQPAPKDDHNPLDDIIIFLDSERNPTRKEFQDITYRSGADECSSCSQHVIGYIREISSELIGLRERINKPAQTNDSDEPAQRLTFRLKDGREIGGIATGITAMPGVIILRDENDPYLLHGVPDNEIAQIFFFTRQSVDSTGDSTPGYHIALDEPLKEYLRLVGCMVSDHRERNFGDAQRWIRHIAKASDAFEKKHGLSPWEMARKNRKNDRSAMLQTGNSPAHSGLSPAQNVVSPAQIDASPTPSPIDHGYRPDCECAGCKATARICAELAGWIPVSERMPETNKFVLVSNGVWVGQGLYDDSEHLESDEHWQDEHREFINVLHPPVTHWMSLPAGPKEVKGE